MIKLFRSLAIVMCLWMLVGCGESTTKGPKPEDTVLVNTSEVRPDWIEELSLDEQSSVVVALSEEDLELRPSILNVDPAIWGDDPNAPKAKVYFDLDKWSIRPIDHTIVDGAAQTLLQNPEMRVLLTGYCDWRGTTDYNLALGERRANSVRDYLVQMGVSAARIDILSRGDMDAVLEATPSQMALDRRVEIIIIQ